jgi:molybdopterin converting factor small subunit
MEAVQTYIEASAFEAVLASLKKVSAMQEENARQIKETDRQMKETDRRLDKQMGKLGNRLGEIIEYMVMPNLITKFCELGFVFTEAYPHSVIKDVENDIYAEIDITLKNGDKVMIVEVKSKPTTEDVTEHIERMQKVKAHAVLHGDKRKFLGAVAGMVFDNNVKTFAMKNGFYVVEPSGETFIITAPEGDYSPKEW